MERFFPGRSAEWKPAATSCCEFRLRTNATVDGGPWFNWNARYGVQGCGEENWSPGPSFLTNERFWPSFDQTPATGAAATCVMPRNPQGAVDTAYCGANSGSYRQPGLASEKRSAATSKRARPIHHR